MEAKLHLTDNNKKNYLQYYKICACRCVAFILFAKIFLFYYNYRIIDYDKFFLNELQNESFKKEILNVLEEQLIDRIKRDSSNGAPASGNLNWMWLSEFNRITEKTLEEHCKKIQQFCPPSQPGPEGPMGIPGPLGEQGDKGYLGITGQKGDKGDPGLMGPPGFDGPIGNPGVRGSPGERGVKGRRGKKGDPGLIGQKGDLGSEGAPGIPGTKGEKGISRFR